MCKPKKDISSTCASVSLMSNSFFKGQSSAQKALRPCGDVSTARPKEMEQCLSEELMTVPAKVLDKATFSLFALTFYVPDVQSRAAVLNESLEERKGELSE